MKILITISFLIASLFSFGQGGQTVVQIPAIPNHGAYNTRSCILKLPNDYATTSNRLPLMIFLHGLGETSTNPSWAYNVQQTGGPAYWIANGNPSGMSSFINPKDNLTYKYIFLTPMGSPSNFPEWNTNGQDLSVMIKYMIDNYRADSTRIYLTGLSQGGAGATYYVTHAAGGVPRYKIAAYIPMEHATSSATTQSMGNTIVADSTRAWGFGDDLCSDGVCDIHGIKTKELIDKVNIAKAGFGRFTRYNGGHCCWGNYYNPSYKETINGRSMNIYEWALQFQQATGNPTPPSNQAPVVNAGSNQTITFPAAVTLNGTGSYDPDGSITSYLWTKASGPAGGTITTPTGSTTTVTGLPVGTHVFNLVVKDNFSPQAQATGTVIVTVTAAGITGTKIYLENTQGYSAAAKGVFFLGDRETYQPGDTIVARSSLLWSYITLKNVYGTAEKPIVLINEGGQTVSTTVGTGSGRNIGGIFIENCRHIKVTGSGSADTYGFYCTTVIDPGDPDRNGVGFSALGRSSDLEFERIYVYKKTYGAWAKQDASCIDSLKYPNFRMNNISIHDCKFFNIGQDVMYLGATHPYNPASLQKPISCVRPCSTCEDGDTTITEFPIPMRLSNIHIYNNILDSAMRTGIQLSGADSGYNEINNNTITRMGFERNQQQGTGISIGGGAYADVHDNSIRQTFINGIFVLGVGLNKVYNNYVDSSGFLGSIKNDTSVCKLPNGKPCSVPFPIMVRARPATPPDSLGFWVYNNQVGRGLTTDSVQIVIQGDFASLYKKTGNKVCGNTKIWNGAAAGVNVNTGISYTIPSPCPGAAINICPSVYAGNDQTITLPSNTTGISASATDQDGTISTYVWTKFSGPSGGTISAPSSATTAITALAQGTYVYEVTATDNSGCGITDRIQIIVNPSVANQLPTAEAGVNQSITLPTSSTTLNGSGQDGDGTISTYLWTKLAGSPAGGTIVSSGSASTSITDLQEGTYQFQLQVTDNSAGTGTDVVNVVVNPAVPDPNQSPTATISNDDISIQLPINFISLVGTGTDNDGTIASYAWTKIAGGAATIVQPTNDSTDITGLEAGTYQFKLTVTDDDGATGISTISVTVQPANLAPSVTVPSDTALSYLPTSSRTLVGSATDADGTIASYLWTQISGPVTATIGSPTAATTLVSVMTTIGIYIFRLSATDNQGGVGSSDVVIAVNANIEPIARVGGPYFVQLTTSSIVISATGSSDIDGSIVSYSWIKRSGPSGGNIASSTSASTNITDLIKGNYEFEVTITDDGGATHSAIATIRVTEAGLIRIGKRNVRIN